MVDCQMKPIGGTSAHYKEMMNLDWLLTITWSDWQFKQLLVNLMDQKGLLFSGCHQRATTAYFGLACPGTIILTLAGRKVFNEKMMF